MNSKIIIGCKQCEKILSLKHEYSIQYNHNLRHLFPVTTAYQSKDLPELLEGYTCFHCENHLTLTPIMFKFITTFFNRPFHIEIAHNAIDISNGELSFAIPIHKEIHSIQQYLADFGVTLLDSKDFLPTAEEVKLMQKAAKDYNHTQWLVRLESCYLLNPYSSANNLWFNL